MTRALALDEEGMKEQALPLYIKAVEVYLEVLDSSQSNDDAMLKRVVGEVLDRIELLKGTVGTTLEASTLLLALDPTPPPQHDPSPSSLHTPIQNPSLHALLKA